MRLLTSLALAIALLATSACASTVTLTPAVIAERGEKTYRAPAGQIAKASSTALRTLGYEITTSDKWRMKTAPKMVTKGAVAYGNASYAKVYVQENSVAWTVELLSRGDAVTVRAVPRFFANGVEQHGAWNEEFLTAQWKQLFSEIESNLNCSRVRVRSRSCSDTSPDPL